MLEEPIFFIETTTGVETANLPQALARLCDGSLLGFDGLAAHQRHAWFLFLCQTAAMALLRSSEHAAAEDDDAWAGLADPASWRQRLAALTPGCAATAWSLLVDDASRPAFMQPPTAAGLDRYVTLGQTPDEIDLLVTAKGHDLKPARAGLAEPRHWVFALTSLQTQQGYSGRGNFGIARMNGGFASRPMLMLTPARDYPTRFRRGLQAALAARRIALDRDDGLFRDDGLTLLWPLAWDSEASLALSELDPLFVEICRRVRLRRASDGGVIALGRPSEVPRVNTPKEMKGNLGDAWIPVSIAEGAALTLGAGGFDYRRLHAVIATEEFNEPAALETRDDDPAELWLHAAVLVRGQGKTEGFHERWLCVPAEMRKSGGPQTAGKISRAMIADADGARKALRIALLTYLQGGPDEQQSQKLDFKDERPAATLEALERRIDEIFFHHLAARFQARADETAAQAAATDWREALRSLTGALFYDALDRLEPPEARRERARSRAGFAFAGLMRKADLARPTPETEEDAG